MENNQRDSFIFYRSYYEAIKELSKEQQSEVYHSIMEYSLNFNLIELQGIPNAIFTLIKPQIEANHKRYLNGLKPKIKQEVSKPKAKDKQSKSKTVTNVNDNVNENDNVNNKDTLDKKDFISFWNSLASKTSLPTLKALTDDRVKHIKARCKDYNLNIEEFKSELESKILASAFLRNETEWNKLSFDWVVKPNNFVKVIEGKYQDEKTVEEKPVKKYDFSKVVI